MERFKDFLNEKLESEVGPFKITIDNQVVSKDKTPQYFDLVKDIRKKFKKEFSIITKEYNTSKPDIVIDGGMIYFYDENGKELISKKMGNIGLKV